MAITSDGNLLSGSSKTSDNSLTITTGVAIAAGKVVVICVAKDNTQTTDSQSNEITSASDSQGNTYTKIGEFTNGQGSSAAGATIAAFYSKLTTALGTSDTITANFSDFRNAKAMIGCSFGVSGSNAIQLVAGSLQTLATDAANPPAMTISGLSSKEYLFVRCIAHERDPSAITPTSSYSSPDTNGSGTSGGNQATNMTAHMEFRILTGTGDSSDPSITTQDMAGIYFALEEVATAAVLTANVGSYSVSGTAANLLWSRLVSANVGSYAISGTATAFIHGYSLSANIGSYNLSGTTTGLLWKRLATGDVGGYVITGVDPTLTAAGPPSPTMVANPGSYTITGTATGLSKGYPITAAVGSYTISGTTTGLTKQWLISANVGAYSISGTATGLLFARRMPANVGAYSITGQTTTLFRGVRITANVGSYVISGQAATFIRPILLLANPGSYNITGQAATFSKVRKLSADPGTYVIFGVAATFRIGTMADLVPPVPTLIVFKYNEIETVRVPKLNAVAAQALTAQRLVVGMAELAHIAPDMGGEVHVWDAPGGYSPAFADGLNWRKTSDGSVII